MHRSSFLRFKHLPISDTNQLICGEWKSEWSLSLQTGRYISGGFLLIGNCKKHCKPKQLSVQYRIFAIKFWYGIFSLDRHRYPIPIFSIGASLVKMIIFIYLSKPSLWIGNTSVIIAREIQIKCNICVWSNVLKKPVPIVLSRTWVPLNPAIE